MRNICVSRQLSVGGYEPSTVVAKGRRAACRTVQGGGCPYQEVRELLGGTIGVESEVGKGSTFMMRAGDLPRTVVTTHSVDERKPPLVYAEGSFSRA